MRIAIDARAWGWTGVGRYIRSLVREFARMQHKHTFVLLLPDDPEVMAEAKRLAGGFEFEIVDKSYYSWREQIILPWQLARVKADLFHFPHFNVPMFFNRPYVVTIHDLTRFYFPGQKRQGLAQQVAYEMVFSRAVKRAKGVICVSNYTAGEVELRNVWIPRSSRGMTKQEISVIYEGVDEEFFVPPSALDRAKVRALLDTRNPYLLFVGVWMSHKNIPRMLRAFQIVRQRHPDLQLVITGKPVPGYMNVLQQTRELNLEGSIIFPGFVPHTLLPALYAESSALLLPSLYEGFGLPALEAAAAGAPVVASNVSSLPEIMADAAEYANPENIAAIARAIERVVFDNSRRQQLIAAGRARAKQFSWKEMAKRTMQIYENCSIL